MYPRFPTICPHRTAQTRSRPVWTSQCHGPDVVAQCPRRREL